ncbi:host-nuclease inhibitor Gam family protein [Enterocloster clostridioformis]|uniref:Bacteriophage Mu Gam like protein n=1 Tax=Enterocloster clostridioformis TaxID=1531 RepID=A0A1I0CLP3_9FIRM|nr:host-nuclease inhibitor Gam family protein [Enterocloster clostridioformis]SET20489.1 Bacteriophage Mu Gam like protein [Enterocloster clostridioformis]SEV89009.1 Bacteriophage Mu Gam like protein [Enterocloster clostridioformis]
MKIDKTMMEEEALALQEQEWDMVVSEEMEKIAAADDGQEAAQEKKAFVIDDDNKADWAIRKIDEEKQEFNRIRELAEEQTARIEQKVEAAERRFNQRTSYLRSLLGSYFMQVPHRKTKTQESYRLLSGSLVLKPPKVKPVYEEDELVKYLKESGMPDYIKTEEKARWGELKKLLDLSQGKHPVIKDTGELVECIRVEETPAEFKVEV